MDDKTFQASLLETQVSDSGQYKPYSPDSGQGHVNQRSYEVELRYFVRFDRRSSVKPKANGGGYQSLALH
jgi:hypothetical protein